MELEEFFRQNPHVALGFSGGVDSAFLLYAALHYGARVGAYYVKTAFQPQFELADAKRLVEELVRMPSSRIKGSVKLQVLELDVLADETIRRNPPDRCYYCKNKIFGQIGRAAVQDGYPVVIDGTNASDKAADRPGMRALAELQVRSPLRECGLEKSEIRRLSKEAGLFTWEKPAYACLATRIPTGREMDVETLQRVEHAEEKLHELGFTDFRVRVYGQAARLQFPINQMTELINQREEVTRALRPWFETVLLDIGQCR